MIETGEIFTFLKQELEMQMMVSDKMLHMKVDREPSWRATTITIIMDALSQPIWHIEYPKDWWQAFKERWFPRWLVNWFPVEYTEHIATRYCPHIAIPEHVEHVRFLLNGT